jgi:hypothetical protein
MGRDNVYCFLAAKKRIVVYINESRLLSIDNEMIIHQSYDQGSKEWVERVFVRRDFVCVLSCLSE